MPVSARLEDLGAALNKAVPKALWSIDKPNQVCAASKKVKVLFAKVKTPIVKCRIVGRVERGSMTVAGEGRDLIVTMPLHATVSARDIGGILKEETAQADAKVRARIRLSVAPNWMLRGSVSIDYDWMDAPHVDFLGQRIEFTSKADDKLKGVIADLQRNLPKELAKLRFRDRVGDAWRAGFTSLKLNDSNPTVWMRITPKQLAYGGYAIEGGTITLKLGMQASTETFIGPRPDDPVASPLPNRASLDQPRGKIVFAIPVIADYSELEPVVARALTKRAQRPFNIPGFGPVTAIFGRVAIYGTTEGRIAVGATFSTSRAGGSPAHGTIWLTAKPSTVPNSRRVGFEDLSVAGITDSTGVSLLIKLANAPGLSQTVADALTQDFSRDYEKLLGKISTAISERRQGDFVIRASVAQVRTGKLIASGQGLYLPVSGEGTASITLRR